MNDLQSIIHILNEISGLLKTYFSTNGAAPAPQKLLSRQQVKDYLGISEATYKRKVKEGALVPIKLPGGDRFAVADLLLEYRKSVNRGRI